MKKLLTSSLHISTLLFFSSSYALNPLDWCYGGLALGVMSFDGRESFSQIIDGGGATNFSGRLSGNQLSYGLFLGCGLTAWDTVLLGGEIYADFARPQSSSTIFAPTLLLGPGFTGAFGSTVRKHGLLGLAGRLGVYVTKGIIPYIKLGTELSGLTYTGVDYNGQKFSRSKNLKSLAVGVGMDFFVLKQMFLRGEWMYTLYNTTHPTPFQFSTGETRNNIKITPRTYAFRLAVGYHF